MGVELRSAPTVFFDPRAFLHTAANWLEVQLQRQVEHRHKYVNVQLPFWHRAESILRSEVCRCQPTGGASLPSAGCCRPPGFPLFLAPSRMGMQPCLFLIEQRNYLCVYLLQRNSCTTVLSICVSWNLFMYLRSLSQMNSDFIPLNTLIYFLWIPYNNTPTDALAEGEVCVW